MSFAHGLYRRFRDLIHEAASFGVVGAIGFVITLGGADLLHFKAGAGPTTAQVAATVVATLVTYVGNRYWSFRHRERTNVPREAVIFFVLNGIGIVIQTVCVDATYYVMGLHGGIAYNAALIVGIGLGTLFRFWSYRKWVWAAPQPGGTAQVPAGPTGGGRPGDGLPAGGFSWDAAAWDGAGTNGAARDGNALGLPDDGPLGGQQPLGGRTSGRQSLRVNGHAHQSGHSWTGASSLKD